MRSAWMIGKVVMIGAAGYWSQQNSDYQSLQQSSGYRLLPQAE